MTVELDRRKVLRMLAAAPVVPGALSQLLFACNNKKNDAGAAGAPGEKAEPFGDQKPAEIPWNGKRRHYDLIDNLSFASLRNEGLLVDFGTSDYLKYTLGGWRTGWGRFFLRDGVAYTHVVGVTTRLYFPWDRSEDLVVRFRAKPFGGDFFSLYMNNKDVQRVDLTKSDWNTYSVKIPASKVVAGENYMLMRWNSTEKVAGENLAAAMDHIHVVPASRAEEGGVLPTQTTISGKARSGKDEAPALLLASGMTLSYWVQVPEDEPLLGFNLGLVDASSGSADMKVRVTARADGSQPAELLSKTLSGEGSFTPEGIDLAGLGGKVVRLDVEATSPSSSQARAALVQPALFTKPIPQPKKPPKPAKNTIVVMIDTLRADAVAPYAKTRVKTPVLDKFATEGAVFERFSAVEDWTKPSCATMLTGLYPCTHQTQTDGAKLPGKVRMIGEEMKGHGVKTGAFIANGYVSTAFGFGRGWDQYTNYIREGKNTNAENVFADAAAWIEQVKGDRFYTYIHTIDPHVPYSPPKEFLEMYDAQPYSGPVEPRQTHLLLEDIKKDKFSPTERDKQRIRALYDGEISYHDKWFGGFLQKLAELDLLDDTLILVVSDHGEEFWDHGNVGHGHQIHQELIHVPFIAMWKGVIPQNLRVTENRDHACMVPTIFDAMQLDSPSYLEGESVLDEAMGARKPGPHAGFSTHQGDRQAVWSENWKLLMRGPVKTYLYDIENDYACTKDLDEDFPIALTYMRALLGQFLGAPDKARWRAREMRQKAALDIVGETVEKDDELQKQLEALGYVQKTTAP